MATKSRVQLKLVGGTEAHIVHQAMAIAPTKSHFQLKVGGAIVCVHQAFESWADPFIRVECNGQEITLVIDKKGQHADLEIKVERTN